MCEELQGTQGIPEPKARSVMGTISASEKAQCANTEPQSCIRDAPKESHMRCYRSNDKGRLILICRIGKDLEECGTLTQKTQ